MNPILFIQIKDFLIDFKKKYQFENQFLESTIQLNEPPKDFLQFLIESYQFLEEHCPHEEKGLKLLKLEIKTIIKTQTTTMS